MFFSRDEHNLLTSDGDRMESGVPPAIISNMILLRNGCLILIILPLSLIYIGGLDSLKLAVLVSALPLTIVYVFMGISLTILLKKHRGNNDISE